MAKKVILITTFFPYDTKEPFLETEIKYWGSEKDLELVIMPLFKGNAVKRDILATIKVDHTLINPKTDFTTKIYKLYKTVFSPIFYREALKTVKKPQTLSIAMHSIAEYFVYKKQLEDYIRSNISSELIFYTYWYTEATYALQSLKKKYNINVVTRTHGYDIYQERREYNYMPYRDLFLHGIDKIYTITDSAKEYLSSVYGFENSILETSRLGVDDNQIISRASKDNRLHIVSCAHLTQVKRVDKIIEALSVFAKEYPSVEVQWTHIGDGPLYTEISDQANILKKINNIDISLIGYLPNVEIYRFYETHRVDLFINVSESEGVPVAIMEAMSCHIPVIAPDIGGIADMVINDHNGVLLSSEAAVGEIVDALKRMDFFKDASIRENAYKIYNSRYNAKNNYIEFINKLKLI